MGKATKEAKVEAKPPPKRYISTVPGLLRFHKAIENLKGFRFFQDAPMFTDMGLPSKKLRAYASQ